MARSRGTSTGRRRPRRWWRWLLGALAVLLLLYGVRGVLLAPLLLRAARAAASRAGVELRVEQLGGTWWRDVALEDVAVRVAGTRGTPVDARVRRLHARYSLLGALRGDPDWVRSIEVSGVSVDLGPASRPSEPSGETWGFSLPPAWPAIDVEDARIGWRSAGGEALEIRGIALRVRKDPSAPRARFSLRAAALTWRDARRDLRRESLVVEGTAGGGRVTIESLVAGGEPWLRDLAVDATQTGEGRLAWSAVLPAPALEGTLDGSLRGFDLEASFDLASRDPAAIAGLLVPSPSPIAASHLAVSGAIAVPLRDAGSAIERATGHLHVEARDLALDRNLARDRGLALEGDLALEGGWLAVEGLHVRRGEDRVEAEGLRIPLRRPEGWEWLRDLEGRFACDIRDLPGILAAVGRDEAIAGPVPDHRLRLQGDLSGPRVTLREGSLETPGGSLALERCRIEFEHDGRLDAVPHVDLAASLAFDDLSVLDRILPVPDRILPRSPGSTRDGARPPGEAAARGWGGSAHGRLDLAGRGLDLRGSIALDSTDLAAAGWQPGSVRLRARLDPERLEVEDLSVRNEFGTVGARAAVDRPAAMLRGGGAGRAAALETLHVEASIRDLARFAPVPGLAGSLDATADLQGGLASPRGRVVASGRALRWTGASAPPWMERGIEECSLTAEIHLDRAARLARVHLASLHLDLGEAVPGMGGALEGVEKGAAEAGAAGAAAAAAALDLRAPVWILAGERRLRWSGMRLAGAAGSLSSWIDVEGDTGTIELILEGLHPSALAGAVLPGGVEVASAGGRLSGTWSPGELEVETEGDASGLRLRAGAAPMALRWAASLGERRLRLGSLEARQGDRPVLSLRGIVPLDPRGDPILAEGPLRLAGWARAGALGDLGLDRFLDDATLEGTADLFADLRGTWREAEGEVSFLASDVALTGRAARSGRRLGPATLSGRIVLGEEGPRLEGGRVDLPGRLTMAVDGSVGLGRDLTAWVDPSRLDWLAVPLRVEGVLATRDLTGLEMLSKGVRRVAGRLDAAVRVAGTLGAPRLEGHLVLEDGELKLASSFPAIAALSADLRFEDDRAVLERLAGELGGAPFRGEGSVGISGAGVLLDLGIRGENLLLYRTGGVRVRADADLRLRGPAGALAATGSIVLRDGRLVRNVDFLNLRGSTPAAGAPGFQLFSFADPPLSGMTFDVDVTPQGAFRVQNNLVRGSLRPSLHLGGTGEVPVATGTIFLDAMRVALPAGPLQVRGGTIEFRPESPFRPELDVAAETRMRGYGIDVHVTGPADAPQVLLSSVPPLPDDRLLLLLLAGQDPGSSFGRGTGEEAGKTVAVFLAQDLLARWTGDESTEGGETWWQRLDVRKGTDVTKAGGETMVVSYRITPEDSGRGRLTFLRGEKDAYDKINFGLRVVFRFR